MGAFSDSIRKNSTKILAGANQKVTAIAEDVFNTVVVKSPTKPEAAYAVGQFINSWYLGINTTDTSSVTSVHNYTGNDSYNRIAAMRSAGVFLGKDGFVTLSNNLDYSDRVEMLGWARTPAYGPVRNSITYALTTYHI